MGDEGGVTLHWDTTSFLSTLDPSFPVIHPIEEPVMTFFVERHNISCVHTCVCARAYVLACVCVWMCVVGDAMHRHK